MHPFQCKYKDILSRNHPKLHSVALFQAHALKLSYIFIHAEGFRERSQNGPIFILVERVGIFNKNNSLALRLSVTE